MNPPAPRATLVGEVRGILDRARAAYAATPIGSRLDALARRLDEPLRVAIAGRVKAGKSTLLNALVGEELAPTDAGECTRIVTWYREGITYRVTLDPVEGEPRQVPFTREGGAIRVDVGTFRAPEVERLVVDWPSAALRPMTLIDTPGIASATEEDTKRTVAALGADEDQPAASDAVLYLMKHLHSSDVQFLDAFRDRDVSQPTPINAIAVLSRADEIGAGKLNALETSERIASRYRRDRRVRTLCQTVVPVAALLAQAGETLVEDEYRALERLARGPVGEVEEALASVDRFLGEAGGSVGPDSPMRDHLVRRMGMFGVRLSVELVRMGAAATAPSLARQLIERSGLQRLRDTLVTQFAGRRDVLKARAALLALEPLVRGAGGPALTDIQAEIERVHAGAHEFAEVRLLNALRAEAADLRHDEEEDAERLLGGGSTAVPARLGLDPAATPAEIREAATAAMARWKARAESPMSSREAVAAARILVRTCEGILAALPPPPQFTV